MKKIKKDVQFWCAVGIVKQMAFREDGSIYDISIESLVGEQHVLYQSALMCGESREEIKKKQKTKKQKTVQLRIENVPLCKECERKYKANSNLLYVKWVEAVSLHGVTAS